MAERGAGYYSSSRLQSSASNVKNGTSIPQVLGGIGCRGGCGNLLLKLKPATLSATPPAPGVCGNLFSLGNCVCNLPRQQVAATSEIGRLQGGCGNHPRLPQPAATCLATPESCNLSATYSSEHMCTAVS